MKYALVNNADEIMRYQDFDEPPAALSPLKGLRWLAVTDVSPPFDPANEKRSAPAITVAAGGVTRRTTVTPKTPAEKETERLTRTQRLESDPVLFAIVRQMAEDRGVTQSAMLAQIKARVP